jgi:transposase
VARQVLQVLADQIEQIETAVAGLERQLLAWHKTNPVSQRLASIPGIGPIIATAIATTVAEWPARTSPARGDSVCHSSFHSICWRSAAQHMYSI